MSIKQIIITIAIVVSLISIYSVINDLVNGTVIDRLSINNMTVELVSSSFSHGGGPIIRVIKNGKVIFKKNLFAFKRDGAAHDYYFHLPGSHIVICVDSEDDLHFVR